MFKRSYIFPKKLYENNFYLYNYNLLVESKNQLYISNSDLNSNFRKEYKIRGYQEVITPRMANVKLWKQSGHFDHYSENMFHIHVKEDENKENPDLNHYLMCPMNCVFHCLIFESKIRSSVVQPPKLTTFPRSFLAIIFSSDINFSNPKSGYTLLRL